MISTKSFFIAGDSRGGGGAGPTSANEWRFLFPDGSTGNQLSIVESEYYDDATSNTDLTTQNDASVSASSADGINLALRAFDNSNGTFWRTVLDGDVGSWLAYDFGAATEIAEFQMRNSAVEAEWPTSVTLQSLDSDWGNRVNYPAIVWNSQEELRFLKTGKIRGTYDPRTGGTSISFDNHAAKGTAMQAAVELSISKVTIDIIEANPQDFNCVIATIDGAGEIQAVLGTSGGEVVAGALQNFTFATPVIVPANQRFVVLAVRLNDGDSPSTRVRFGTNLVSGARIETFGAYSYRTTTPAPGDTPSRIEATQAFRTIIEHEY